MAFTATLESVQRAGDPGFFDLGVSYADTAVPDWSVHKTLRVTVDSSQTATQQRAALVAAITADAQRYKTQAAIQAALTSLIGQTVTV